MVTAYETIVHKSFKEFVNPTALIYATMKHEELLLVRTYVHIIMIHLKVIHVHLVLRKMLLTLV